MKELTDERIKNGNEISKEVLIDKIKVSDPTRFDQMLIEKEERKTYFYINYKSVAFTRTPYVLKFPLFKDLKDDFENSIKENGEIMILENESLIQKIKSKGKEPEVSKKYSNKNLVFSELKIKKENSIISPKQPMYYIPSDTERCTCNKCDGEKYTTCKETECKGQHIYDCNKCKTSGKIDCEECNAKGEYTCPSCNGRGSMKCSGCGGSGKDKRSNSFNAKCKDCNGSGERKCSSYNSTGSIKSSNGGPSILGGVANLAGSAMKKMSGNEYCGGTGIIRCKTCSTTGKIICDKCEGGGNIECKTCYSDHVDDRYGKVDCIICETAGELASITYITTEIKTDTIETIHTEQNSIDAPDFGTNSIKRYVNNNALLELTYLDLKEDSKLNYNDFSSLGSMQGMAKVGIFKDKYPKLIQEELYIEGVPCVTFNYNHILTASKHDVSLLSIDKEQDVLFHSTPTSVAEEKASFKDKLNELFRQAFSTKAYKDKIDRKHEMFLMVHMAKADGIIEEQEKRYLSQTITGLQGFTNKEKKELFDLMSTTTLPTISPANAYFSSKERAEEAKVKLVELVAKADGEYEPEEKAKVEEINNAIELGYKAKPSSIGRFFKTWQISIPIVLLIISLSFLIVYLTVFMPKQNSDQNRTSNSNTIENNSNSIDEEINEDFEELANVNLNDVVIEDVQKSVFTEELTLVDNFDGDGSPILIFENAAGEMIQIESFDDNIINSFMEEDDYGIYYVKEKYLTKSFLVTYETKLIVSAEATENGEEGYIGKHIIKMELKK